jgi:hypothetical protein
MSATSVTLLTPAASNPKTAKGEALPYEAAILHLSPADRSGYNTCPYASPGCKHACLNTAGHGGIGGDDNSVQRARIRKTRWFFEDRAGFMAQLVKEIAALERRAAKRGRVAVVRLNGTSDIGWSRVPCEYQGVTWPNLFYAFPWVTFYDYTKVPSRIGTNAHANYFLTFSLSESNDAHAAKALACGMNVAVVLNLHDSEPMPALWSGYRVIDGTTHDFRFLDPQGGAIVALRPKGRAKHDGSGFVRNLDASIDTTRKLQLAVVPMAAD